MVVWLHPVTLAGLPLPGGGGRLVMLWADAHATADTGMPRFLYEPTLTFARETSVQVMGRDFQSILHRFLGPNSFL